jgi:hypothetical protein
MMPFGSLAFGFLSWFAKYDSRVYAARFRLELLEGIGSGTATVELDSRTSLLALILLPAEGFVSSDAGHVFASQKFLRDEDSRRLPNAQLLGKHCGRLRQAPMKRWRNVQRPNRKSRDGTFFFSRPSFFVKQPACTWNTMA